MDDPEAANHSELNSPLKMGPLVSQKTQNLLTSDCDDHVILFAGHVMWSLTCELSSVTGSHPCGYIYFRAMFKI